jgi:uncharacterized integral membrane protein (TIGR00697 family)
MGSMMGFWIGDFVNSFIMAKMKILTKGRYLWTRTIGSTLFGQAADSCVFYPFAFYNIWTSNKILDVIIFNCVFKILVEVLFTPVTYFITNLLKKKENSDYYDRDTNFTPFSLEIEE